MDREKFQKDVDDEETAKKAKDADKDPKRMLAPTRQFTSVTEFMDTISVMRYSPPSGFSGLEPGSGHTAGMMFPGTEPLQNPASTMWSETNGTPIGDGPEAHTADQGADEGNNITLEVWPQGFVNLLIGGKPSGSATIGGMVVGGRAFTEEDKFSTREDGTKVPIEPMRVAITAPGILSLISKADEGLEYRRQLELDGVKYAIARDQSRANPDLHMRVMRSISEITTLKKYVEDLRESALEKYRVNPPVNKELSDFLRIPERQTSAPAPGLGNRNINLGKDRATVDDPMNDAGLYKG
jgi:hypothetical protein